MIRQRPSGGRIVNNGSLSAHVPRPNAIAYTTTKHGISGLTKALASRAAAWDRLRSDRHRERRHRHDPATRGRRAPGRRLDRRRADDSVDAAADAVLYMVGLPLDANVLSMTVMASGMPYVGRG